MNKKVKQNILRGSGETEGTGDERSAAVVDRRDIKGPELGLDHVWNERIKYVSMNVCERGTNIQQ